MQYVYQSLVWNVKDAYVELRSPLSGEAEAEWREGRWFVAAVTVLAIAANSLVWIVL